MAWNNLRNYAIVTFVMNGYFKVASKKDSVNVAIPYALKHIYGVR